ncbi:MAG: hypothetical protein ACJAZS_000024 [Alteromonas naphthalenivorans]|jgi:hypothetical protein
MLKKYKILLLHFFVLPIFASECLYSDKVRDQIVQIVKNREQGYSAYYITDVARKNYVNFCKEAQQSVDAIRFLVNEKQKKWCSLNQNSNYATEILSFIYGKNPSLRFLADYYENPEHSFSKKIFEQMSSKQFTTNTLRHLAASITETPDKIPKKIISALSKAHEKEEELIKEGYVVFYHGQFNKWGFVQEFTRMLINALHEKNYIQKALPKDFFFIQNFPTLNDALDRGLSNTILEQEKKIRLDTLRQGWTYNANTYNLYTNMFLFGNSHNLGSCTWQYVERNTNINTGNEVDLTREVFENLGVKKTDYELFVDSFNTLLLKYKNCFQAGRLLQVAIPKDKVDECVYFGHQGKSYTKNGKPVTKVTDLLTHLKSGDDKVMQNGGYGELEYVIPLTKDIMLNPDSGVKVFAYGAGIKNQKKYNAILKEMEQLAEDIVYSMWVAKSGSFFSKYYSLLSNTLSRAKSKTKQGIKTVAAKSVEWPLYGTFKVLDCASVPADVLSEFLRRHYDDNYYYYNYHYHNQTTLQVVKKKIAVAVWCSMRMGVGLVELPGNITRDCTGLLYEKVSGQKPHYFR